MNAAGARIYLLGAVAFVGVAVVGSLHPFDVHRVPLTVVAAMFWDAGAMDPARWSVTDIVSNFLLFVPIGLCASAAFGGTHPARAAAIVVAGGILLSTTIEFGQAFVSWRTPSILDVFTEGLGTAAGAALRLAARTPIDRLVTVLTAPYRDSTPRGRLLLIYVGAFSWFWLLPFDFTIRPEEIIDKYEHLRLLLPFSPSPDAASRAQLQMMTAAAVPVGMAAVLCDSHGGLWRGVLGGVCWILALTLAQVFVFSRTTDATLVVAAIPGLALGAGAARFRSRAAAGAAR